MPDDARALLRDTLAYLKDPLLPKQVIFASEDECVYFQRKKEASKPTPAPPAPKEWARPMPAPVQRSAPPPVAVVERKIPTPSEKSEEAPKEEPKVVVESVSPIKKTLQRIAPHLKLVDQVPDDAQAKRVANAWKEKISDAEVALLACDTNPETLELLKTLAKAIDQNLAKSKVIAAERLEREKRWDLFLEKNAFRLIIATEGMQKLSELMRYYKAVPANTQYFLGQTPLLPLAAASIYKSLEHKALLWKTLCQMLKK